MKKEEKCIFSFEVLKVEDDLIYRADAENEEVDPMKVAKGFITSIHEMLGSNPEATKLFGDALRTYAHQIADLK